MKDHRSRLLGHPWTFVAGVPSPDTTNIDRDHGFITAALNNFQKFSRAMLPGQPFGRCGQASGRGRYGLAPAASAPATPGIGAPPPATQRPTSAAPAAEAEDEEDEDEYEDEEEGVSARIVNLMASCGVSLVVHFALVLALGLMTLAPVIKNKVTVIESSVTEPAAGMFAV